MSKKKKEMDLAPEESEKQMSGQARRRQERRWAREALGFDDDDYNEPSKKVVIAPRQKNESERDFRNRLKAESGKILREQNDATSLSKQRRKQIMKDRAEAKKKRATKDDDLEPAKDTISFGERAHEPPRFEPTSNKAQDLTQMKAPSKKRKKSPEDPKMAAVRQQFSSKSRTFAGWERSL